MTTEYGRGPTDVVNEIMQPASDVLIESIEAVGINIIALRVSIALLLLPACVCCYFLRNWIINKIRNVVKA